MFKLHDRLEADTLQICDLELSTLRLMNDRRFSWVILIPQREFLVEWHDTSRGDRDLLMEEIACLSEVLKNVVNADKVNVASLGNLVPQLHIHVVGRFKSDVAWPGPVWGVGTPDPYAANQAEELIGKLRVALPQN